METTVSKPVRQNKALLWAWIALAFWFALALFYGNGFDHDEFMPGISLLLFVLIANCVVSDGIAYKRVRVYGCAACMVAALLAAYETVYCLFEAELSAATYNYGMQAANSYRFDFGDVVTSEAFLRLLIGGLLVSGVCVALVAYMQKKILRMPVYGGIIAALFLMLGLICTDHTLLYCIILALFAFSMALLLKAQEKLHDSADCCKLLRWTPLVGAVLSVILTLSVADMTNEIFLCIVALIALIGGIAAACGKVWGIRMNLLTCGLMVFAVLLYQFGGDGSNEAWAYFIPLLLNLFAAGFAAKRFGGFAYSS